MSSSSQDRFFIGNWLVEPSLNRISDANGSSAQLEPKIMGVLLCLAENPGEVVSRERLLDRIWPDTFVVERVLTRAISELRKAFADDARNPRFIETVHKSGYRLIAPVRPAEEIPAVPVEHLETLSQPRISRRTVFALAVFLITAIAFVVITGLKRTNTTESDSNADFEAAPLTSFQGWEYDPAISPDGQKVAFVWNGDPPGSWDIYIQQIGEAVPLHFTHEKGAEGSPAWSPDGRYIAYYRHTSGSSQILMKPALAGPEQRLADCNAQYPDLSWSPDGKWLAFNEKPSDDGPHAIVLLSMESGDKRTLTRPPPSSWGDSKARFSPDGMSVSFARTMSEGIQDLYLIGIADGEERRLTHETRSLYGQSWLSNGRKLLFSSSKGGRTQLWMLSLNGEEPVRLSAGLGASNPSLLGDRLVYEEWSSETNIWRIPLNNTAASSADRLIHSTRWDLHPDIAPDGKRIAFSSNRSGSYEIWISESDGANPRRLTHLENLFAGTPRWSPDGKWIAFDARPQGQADLYIIASEGGAMRRLTFDEADDMAASWSPDGKWIYFASSRGGTWQVWKIPIDGSEASQVTKSGGFAARASEDGRFLYYTKANQAGLWRMPLEGGEEKSVLDYIEASDWGNWLVRGERIYFISRQVPSFPRRNMIQVFDMKTGKTDGLFTTENSIPSGDVSIALSPDGKWILFGQSEKLNCDLMLVNNFPLEVPSVP